MKYRQPDFYIETKDDFFYWLEWLKEFTIMV
jgi:hypothetical protein